MLWSIHCIDKAGSAPLRTRHMPAHARYFTENQQLIFVAGPLLDDTGSADVGSFYLIDAPDRAAATAFVENDPLFTGGIFETVRITRFRRGRFFNPQLGEPR